MAKFLTKLFKIQSPVSFFKKTLLFRDASSSLLQNSILSGRWALDYDGRYRPRKKSILGKYGQLRMLQLIWESENQRKKERRDRRWWIHFTLHYINNSRLNVYYLYFFIYFIYELHGLGPQPISRGARKGSGSIVVFIQGLTWSWGLGGSERTCKFALRKELPMVSTPIK